jgi:hypothetical protein
MLEVRLRRREERFRVIEAHASCWDSPLARVFLWLPQHVQLVQIISGYRGHDRLVSSRKGSCLPNATLSLGVHIVSTCGHCVETQYSDNSLAE